MTYSGDLREVLTLGRRFDAINKARTWVSTTAAARSPLYGQRAMPRQVTPPKYPAEDLLSFVNPDIRQPLNMMEVVLRIVDGGRVEIFKPAYGTSMLTAWAYIHGALHLAPKRGDSR